MRAVIQRVIRARVTVERLVRGEIGPGLMALVAVGRDDSTATAATMAEKIANLRIFKWTGHFQERRGTDRPCSACSKE